MSSSKKYGLILRDKSSKKNDTLVSKIFKTNSSESDSDSEHFKPRVTNKVKLSTKAAIDKALADDPTIYDYDGALGEIDKKKEQTKTVEKKPKYILGLMKAAVLRQKEQELRDDRKVEKERQAEGDEFDNKEVFVTAAYKAKLEERKILAEERSKQDRIDGTLHIMVRVNELFSLIRHALELTDVTKQKDLSGFYRHILHERTAEEPDEEIKSNDSSDTNLQPHSPQHKPSVKKERSHLRSRHRSDESETSEKETPAKRLRHDSDSSSDDVSPKPQKNKTPEMSPKSSTSYNEADTPDKNSDLKNHSTESRLSEDESLDPVEIENKKRLDLLFKKHYKLVQYIRETLKDDVPDMKMEAIVKALQVITTGDRLTEAKTRYWQRKADGLCEPKIITDGD